MSKDAILIGCEVVINEFCHRIGQDFPIRTIDPSLHVNPDRLRKALQDAIDQEEKTYNTILLGYGLCSRAVEGLKSRYSNIVIPRVDDCVGLFLGSRDAHLEQIKTEPGTFFLSKGWIETGSTPFEEYKYMLKRFGKQRADQLMNTMLKHYQRLVFIHMGLNRACSTHCSYAYSKSTQFGLEYHEMNGSSKLFDDLLSGEENDDLQQIGPGETIVYDMFFKG